MADLRHRAACELARYLVGDGVDATSATRPTEYQARRLALLLAILDLRSGAEPVTSHEIARRLVYPRLSLARGAAWKSSAERRRTQRLIREAEAMRAADYRLLLAGRTGRQK